jgi:hypothetical protein
VAWKAARTKQNADLEWPALKTAADERLFDFFGCGGRI